MSTGENSADTTILLKSSGNVNLPPFQMAGWGEVSSDVILGSFYIFMLIRLSISTDEHLRTPFYTFFITTGIYSMIAVISYQIVAQFQFSEKYWTVYIFKISFGVNALAARAATIGKAFIAIHRYDVIRSREFSEKKWTPKVMRTFLAAQLFVSLISTAPVWPASYVYRNEVIIALDPTSTLIQKTLTVTTYVLYILCNGVLTVLTSRELLRLKSTLKANTDASRSIITQQRHMFIIVAVCSVSHLIKTFQQVNLVLLVIVMKIRPKLFSMVRFLLTIAFATYFEMSDLYAFIWPLYPLANGLATYAAPACLVCISRKVRNQMVFTNRMRSAAVSSTNS